MTAHDEPQLLAGASLYCMYVIDDAGRHTDANAIAPGIPSIHEKQIHDEIIQRIRSLGGTIVNDLQGATHAVWINDDRDGVDSSNLRISPRLETAVMTATALQIPIVAAVPWLHRIMELFPGGEMHWSDVPVADLVPSIVPQILRDVPSQALSASAHTNTSTAVRRDQAQSLGRSIAQTFHYLVREDPDRMEQQALQRALELSLLDCAIVLRSDSFDGRHHNSLVQTSTNDEKKDDDKQDDSPYRILGLATDATPVEIKSAYRKLARTTHPDKGGSEAAFQEVALAYRSLLVKLPNLMVTDKLQEPKHLKSTSHWDKELADHRRLVEELFASHGANIQQTVAAQQQILQHGLKLQPKSAGSTNRNERAELIHNSCFYLSLAASYLSGIGALMDTTDDLDNSHLGTASDFGEEDRFLIGETALQLKRRIEAAVLQAHPEWAEAGMVGEQVQAFSDFLVYLLDSPGAIVSEWAVVVFDTTSGVCDVYKGKYYEEQAQQQGSAGYNGASANCITIQYMPGHYEPLLPVYLEQRPTLQHILEMLDANSVMYVVTDGAA